MIRTYVSPPWHAVEPGGILGSPEFGVGPEELLEWSDVLDAREGSLVSILYFVLNRAGSCEGVITCEKQSRVGGPEGKGSCLPRGGTPTRQRAPLWRRDGWQIAAWEQPWQIWIGGWLPRIAVICSEGVLMLKYDDQPMA